MVERSGYADGEPCWAELTAPDVEAAKSFYSALFGWTFVDTGPEFGGYVMCSKNDKTVAAITPPMSEDGMPPMWNTYLKSSDADATAQRIEQGGGKLLMAPMDVPDNGRFLFALDPGGAAFGVWQPGKMTGAQLYAEPGAIAWTEVNTREPAAVDAFYRSLFGYELEQMGGDMDYVVYKAPGGQAYCGRMKMTAEFGDIPPHWMVYFGVDDADAAAGRATAAGGQVRVPPFDSPFGRIAVIGDPNGAVLSIIDMETRSEGTPDAA